MNRHKFVFICGLHRSGTSVLAKCLGEHPLISAFKNTGVPEDEGQHLQTVYPPAYVYGGAGKFGFRAEARLTEESPLVTEENKFRLFSDWSRHWDTTRPLLLEKSPPNLIRTRFLQSMFPASYFIVLTRHPVAVSLATQKWGKRGRPLHKLIKHWLTCHELFQEDSKYLTNVLVLKYEDLVARPENHLHQIFDFLGLQHYPAYRQLRAGINQKYYLQWQKQQNHMLWKHYASYIINKYEQRVQKFGYSLLDLDWIGR